MKTLGVGLVGYGLMGKMHTYAYKSLPMLYEPAPAGIRLVGVAAPSQASRDLAMQQAGFQFSTPDYRDLLARPDIDIINCCTPNNVHREVVVDAIRAGKHVYVDKPLAGNLAEALEIVKAEAAAESAGEHKTRQMAFDYRFVPAIMRARELLQEGRLGRVYTFALRYIHNSNADPKKPLHWKSDRSVGGGVLADLGSHIIDLTRFLLGDFDRILSHPFTMVKARPDGQGNMRDVNGDDATFMIAQLKSGAVGTLEASKLATGSNDELTIDIRGERGAITCDLMDPNWLNFYDNALPDAVLGGAKGFTRIESVQRYPAPAVLPGPKVSIGWMRFHIHSLYSFVRRVVAGEAGSPGLLDGLAAQDIIETAYSSPGVWTEVTRSLPVID